MRFARYGNRLSGSDLENPDFVALTRSFGAWANRVTEPGELRDVLAKAIEHGGPAVIEVMVGRDGDASPWPLIHPAPHT